MSGERELIEEYFRVVWMEGHWERVHEHLAPDYANHGSVTGLDSTSIEDGRRVDAAMRAVFPDIVFELPRVVAGEGWAARHWTAEATHQAEFLGIAATGRKVHMQGMVFSRIEGGKIKEEWRIVDNAGLIEQLRQ